MLASMTGFARASSNVDNVTYNLEIKALNGNISRPTLSFRNNCPAMNRRSSNFFGTSYSRVHRFQPAHAGCFRAFRLSGESRSRQAYLHALENFLQDQPGKNLVIDLPIFWNYQGFVNIRPGPDATGTEWQISIGSDGQSDGTALAMRLQEGQSLKDDLLKHCTKIARR